MKYDNYFMMGDNRDNSLDSRYWGYLNHNFIKAKAFILYFSLNKEIPLWQLPLKIRWERIGKLIRVWGWGSFKRTPYHKCARLVLHECRLPCGLHHIPPQFTFRIDHITSGYCQLHRYMNEGIVDQTDQHLRFSRHSRMYRICAQP